MSNENIDDEDFEECDKIIHKLRCLSQCSQNINEINDFIKTDIFKEKVLSRLGVHAGIWAYVDIMENNKLFYLTENFVDSNIEDEEKRNIEWPTMLSIEDTQPTCSTKNNTTNTKTKKLRSEDDHFTKATNKLISIARRREAKLYDIPIPLKNLGQLALLKNNENKTECFSEFERNEKVLYVPSGELLTAILGWTISTQEQKEHLSFPRDLTKKLTLTETLANSNVYKILAHVLNEVKGLKDNYLLLQGCATIAFLSCSNEEKLSNNRPVCWGQVLCDLGLIKHKDDRKEAHDCGCITENDGFILTRPDRLQTIAWWLIQQHESSCFFRPGLQFNLTNKEVNILNSFSEFDSEESESWEILTLIFSILQRVKFDNSLDWESIYNFGLGAQQMWLRVNAERGWRWVLPYDWCCMQVMPELSAINKGNSASYIPAGSVFLSLEAKAHRSLNSFEKKFRRIRTLVLIFALNENRLTYDEKIRIKADSLTHFYNAIELWNWQFYHEFVRLINKITLFIERQEKNEKSVDAIRCSDTLRETFEKYFKQDKNIGNPVRLYDLINETLRNWPTLKVNENNLTIDNKVDKNINVTLSLYIKIILVNILSNPFKHAALNSKLSISTSEHSESAKIQYLFIKNIIPINSFLLRDIDIVMDNKTIKYNEWTNYYNLKQNDHNGIQIITAILKAMRMPNAEFMLNINTDGDKYFILKIPITFL